MMKKFIFLFAGILFISGIHAQHSFGIRAAYNNTTTDKSARNADIESINRIQLGVYGKLSVFRKFFLRGSLLYDQKGNIYDDDKYFIDAGKRVTIKLNYVEAAVDLGYALKLVGKHKILFGVGPYLAYGLNGTEKGYEETLFGRVTVNRKVNFTNADYTDGKKLLIKPVDFGLNFNLGYQYRKYGVFFNYGLGLSNRQNPEYLPVYKTYNRVASVGVSYGFR